MTLVVKCSIPQVMDVTQSLKIIYEEESKSNLNIFLLTEYVQIGLKTLRHFST
jgi:hypothetical protein